jgi:hypothetical protein
MNKVPNNEMNNEPINMTNDELLFDMKYPLYVDKKDPMPKFKNNKAKMVMCSVCLKSYRLSNRYNHEKTKYHKIYAGLNEKLRNLLLIQTV